MKIFFLNGAAALIFFLLAGCANRSEPEAPIKDFDTNASVLIINDQLAKQLEVIDLKTSLNEKKVLKAVAQIKNISDKPVTLQARALYKNDQGMTLEVSPWEDFAIREKGHNTFHSTSNIEGSSRFLLQLRLKQ
jgi:uncharacterized protein YcfL